MPVDTPESTPTSCLAWGHGLATIAEDDDEIDMVLDTWFPHPQLGGIPEDAPAWPDDKHRHLTGVDSRRQVRVEPVTVIIDLDEPVQSTSDAYLRLHLLSHRKVLPNTINLDGIYPHLPIVAFTNTGSMSASDYRNHLPQLLRMGIQAYSLDKFPRLTDYVVPDRVRIADASRVRLGAYLSPGTTVMHEGFVNFNAGTLGASMVEGRISQGVIVGDGSDIGGGASIMGTLSGGGTQRVVIGERSLLGANSGVGISIGDDCIVEAGLYLTAGTKVAVLGAAPSNTPRTVKALELSGAPGLLFRRNSLTGAVEALPRTGSVQLNTVLHA